MFVAYIQEVAHTDSLAALSDLHICNGYDFYFHIGRTIIVAKAGLACTRHVQ